MDNEGYRVSFGEGVEREVILGLFLRYTTNGNQCQWLNPQADSMSSLKILFTGAMSMHVSESRKLELAKFGAVVALSLLEHQAPEPIDPCVLQYIIHKKDFHSLHPAFVAQWHPELADCIRRWEEIGPNGDIKEFNRLFMSYANTTVRFANCNES